MKIFILRHGQAEPYQTSDSARRLTKKGVADTHKVLTEKLLVMSEVDAIWASPFVRAQQTAAIASELFKKELQTTHHLEPEASLDELLAWLQELNQEAVVLLVSHLPLVGMLANSLCNFDENRIQFDTSSLIGITCEFPAKGMGEVFLEVHA